MNSAQAPAATVERLGIKVDQLILEVGFDQSDCDQTIRDAITAKTGNKFLDATSQEVVDAVILWWLRYRDWETDRKSTRLNSSHSRASRMPSSA